MPWFVASVSRRGAWQHSFTGVICLFFSPLSAGGGSAGPLLPVSVVCLTPPPLSGFACVASLWRWSGQRAQPRGSTPWVLFFRAGRSVGGAILTSDRDMDKKLADARKLLQESRFGDAIRNLDSILEAPQDSFFQTEKESSVPRSLKAEALRLMDELPQEGRELYELQYGARAGKMLDEALATNDTGQLADVSRCFF